MDINKHIIDQRVRKLVDDRPEWFEGSKDERNKISKAFLILSMASSLEMDISEAYSCVTEGGDDAGVDGLYIGDTHDYEFSVVIFQSKYHFNLEKEYSFPDNSVLRVVNAIGTLFNPSKDVSLNKLIKPKIEEIRSLILDGYIPTVKCVLTNNGSKWLKDGEQHIENASFPENQVTFTHYNHLDIAKQLQSSKEINDSIKLSGKAVIEDFDFKRVLIGKVSISEIGALMQRHGDFLLEKNIRKYLGLNKNRVNQNIQSTLLTESKRRNFYFFNNGITMLCKKFSHNALMEENWQLKLENIQIINGGQTSKTILETVVQNPDIDFTKTTVLLRLYEVSEDDHESVSLTTDITIATNSQTPVDLRDLRANDSLQKEITIAVGQLGYKYLTKKGTGSSYSGSDTIPSSVAAESVFSIWKKKPHLAKYKRSELFGKFYNEVFKDVNGVHIVIAVLIFRFCDSNRKKEELIKEFKHISYSNYYLSMLCGDILLERKSLSFSEVSHINFDEVKSYWNENKESIYNAANAKINEALNDLFPKGLDELDPRRIAATFRRGDLLIKLESK